ncbi:MAG: PTO1314 family radical SAM protein [Candidatus Bathyarchaeia archaeon]
MRDNALSYQETLRVGFRLYRGFLLNSLRVKTPVFGGHKLTYNCNLKCKMCPFWKRSSENLSTLKEKEILRQFYDSGVCAVAFEGGEPLLREDLPEILAYSRSLPLHTSLITNGTLLKSRVDEIAPHISGIVFVSLDGPEKIHDKIRGVNGTFRRAVDGINAAKERVSITINMTLMSENLSEVEEMVKLAKDLGVKIVFSLAYGYHSTDASAPKADEIKKVAKQLLELKKKNYPIMNSTSYFKVIAREKKWTCKPWSTINIGPDGRLVLPCYVHNQYETGASVFENSVKAVTSSFDWEEVHDCVKCNLHCYVEPSLVLSWDLRSWADWVFPTKT